MSGLATRLGDVRFLADPIDVTIIVTFAGLGSVAGLLLGAIRRDELTRWAGVGSLWGAAAGVWFYAIALLAEVL